MERVETIHNTQRNKERATRKNSKNTGGLIKMPEIRIYSDMEHFIKHRKLDSETKEKINKKAQQLIYEELDKLS